MELERSVGLRPDGTVWLPRAARGRQLDPAQARGHGRADPGRHRRRGGAPPDRRSLRALPRADPAAVRAPLPGRPAHPALHRRPVRAVGARRAGRACPAKPSSSTATVSRASCRCRSTGTRGTTSSSRATGSTTACCTTRRAIAGPPRACSTSPRAGCRSRPTRSRCRSSPTRGCCEEALRPPAVADAPAVHGRAGQSRSRRWCRCCCARWCARRCPRCSPEKRMEVRFFVPGGLVSNLDFVESIFGNAGDPYLPENDAGARRGSAGPATAAASSSRRTSRALRKKDLGLPHVSQATEAASAPRHVLGGRERALQRRAAPSRSPSRGIDGVMVTILADNYFGYCKKEVKTQIGFSANLFGLAEEEHAGGALAFATFSLGDRFVAGAGADRERQPPLRRGAGARSATRGDVHAVRLRHRRDVSRDPLHARGHGDRRPAPGHHVDERGQEQHLKLLPGPHLHPSERLQDPHGQAPRGAELAAGRHGARGRLLPQAVHRLGRRQVGDQQEPGRRGPARVVLRRAASRRTWRWSSEIFDRRLRRRPATRAPRRRRPRALAARSCRPSARSAR